tara:strand:+ start:1524 stop:2402 length:879 start_codon:yes stop_codon:yes gene_type:complete
LRILSLIILIATATSCNEDVVSSKESLSVEDIFHEVNKSAIDRCAVRDCTCKVKRGKKKYHNEKEIAEKRRQAVFFLEGSSVIDENQSREITNFISQFKKNKNIKITIVGYTDGCGSREYNKSLSSSRAAATAKKIRSILGRPSISIISAGEKSSGHTQEARRVDVIVHTKSAFITRIEKVPADVYLIDASGSMWDGWRDWNDLVNASLKPEGRIYVSMMRGCTNGQSLASISPQSGTEIWYSYWIVLDRMKKGETLAIVSDLKANFPLRHWEHKLIAEKVSKKNIRVVLIQ